MRISVFQVATFLIVATAAFPQKPAATTDEVSQKDEQQVRQVEAELLNGEMNSASAIFEKFLAEDCVILPHGSDPGPTKAKVLEAVRKSEGKAPPYTATVEDMHVYVLGDTVVAMYVKTYAVRANPSQVDRHDLTDVFVRSAGTWKLKISRSSPHQKAED